VTRDLRFVVLAAQGDIMAEFHKVAPLFDRVVGEAAHGEFTTADLMRLGMEGRLLLGYAERDGRTVVAAAFEFVHYPRLKALNVVALAGEPLEFRGAFDGYWRQLTEFARSCGCARIEAKCSRAMARLLRAGYGFASVYEHVGIDLPTETKV